jgi:hypothetical protein
MHARQFGEGEVAGFGVFTDPNRSSTRVEGDRDGFACDCDGAVLDAGALLDATFRASRVFRVGFRGGDPVDG